jgi:uncharacterized membrane protein (DUF373 family)
MNKILRRILIFLTSDELFLNVLHDLEIVIAKVLSLAMVAVIIVSTGDLVIFLYKELLVQTYPGFKNTLFYIFGLFLNVLIALEILENITAYLKKHVVQVELVIVTSLIAVARKIIILDLEKTGGLELIGLAIAILSLSLSFLVIRFTNNRNRNVH